MHCDADSGVNALGANIRESTIVVDQGIVEPVGMNFYMQAAGTKKAIHFRVLHDQNSFTMTEMENYTHQLCLFGSSVPVPLDNAEKLVGRSKLYIQTEYAVYMKIKHKPNDVSDYLNQKLFNTNSIISLVNKDGKRSYV